jgi:hypothetical protein
MRAPRTVRFNVYGQDNRTHWLLHLLNYAPTPAQNFKVSLAVPAAKVTLLTPDRVPTGKVKFKVTEGRTEFTIPTLDLYALVVVQPREEAKPR